MVLVSRAMPARVIQAGPRPHHQVVVTAEEGTEAEPLGCLGYGQEVVIGGALLGLGEDAEVHTPFYPGTRDATAALFT
jgi:hypothetical protein